MESNLCFNSRTKSTIVILRSCNCILLTKYDRCVQNMAHRDGCKSVTDWVIGNDSEKRQGNSSTSRRTKVAITTGIKNGLHWHMHIRKRWIIYCDIHLLTRTIIIKRIVLHIFVSIFVQHVHQPLACVLEEIHERLRPSYIVYRNPCFW